MKETRRRSIDLERMRLLRCAGAAAALASLAAAAPALAQDPTATVVFDNSLGVPGAAPAQPFGANGTNFDYRIEATRGRLVGDEQQALFHSFERFDVHTGDAASFLGPESVEKIFARVTGSASEIDGLLRSEIPGADLYFLNPRGILFGENASLDVGGSFYASSADRLKFGNGFSAQRFEAVRGGAVPTLAFAAPPAFGFLKNGAPPIRLEGTQLHVDAGETLGLIGDGEVTLEGTRLDASSIGGADAGHLRIEGDEVRIVDGSRLHADASPHPYRAPPSGNYDDYLGDAGSVEIRARTLQIANGSGITARAYGIGHGGTITLEVSKEASISGKVDAYGPLPFPPYSDWSDPAYDFPFTLSVESGHFTGPAGSPFPDIISAVDANPGRIEIRAPYLSLGGLVYADGLSERGIRFLQRVDGMPWVAERGEPPTPELGRGVIEIHGDEVRITGDPCCEFDTRFAFVRARSIEIHSRTLEVTGELFGVTSSVEPGRVHVWAGERVSVLGNGVVVPEPYWMHPQLTSGPTREELKLGVPGGIYAFGDPHAFGAAIEIDTPELRVAGGAIAALRREAFGFASSLEIPLRVDIDADRVFVSSGGAIDVSNRYMGNLGDARIDIDATKRIEISGSSDPFVSDFADDAISLPSRVSATVTRLGFSTFCSTDSCRAQSGDIFLRAPDVVLDGGVVSSGIIQIGRDVEPYRDEYLGGYLESRGGDLLIDGDRIVLRNGGRLLAGAAGHGWGGEIRVAARDSIRVEGADSGVIGSVMKGEGGDIRLDAPLVEVSDGARISSETVVPTEFNLFGDFERFVFIDEILRERARNLLGRSFASDSTGSAGNITIGAGTDRLALHRGSITTDGQGQADAGSIQVLARSVSASDGSLITSRSLGSGSAGLLDFDVEKLALSDSDISAFAAQGPAALPREGSIAIGAEDVLLEQGSTISSSVTQGLGGDVEIEASDSVVLLDGSQILARTENGNGGAIQVSTQGLFIESEAYTGTDKPMDADAGVGTSGTVLVDSPEIDLERQTVPLAATYLDASSQLRPVCAARAAGEGGSFRVSTRRGLPASPDGLLVAFESLGEATPPIAAGPGFEITSHAAQRGGEAFRGGRYDEAESEYAAAVEAQLAAPQSDPAARSDALRGLAQSQQARGEWGKSVVALEQSLAALDAADDPARRAAALGHLGNAWLALGEEERATAALAEARAVALRSDRPDLAARLENDRGNQQTLRGAHADAISSYEAAAELAARAGNAEAQAIALSNAARAALEAGEDTRAHARLARARKLASQLDAGETRLRLTLHLARSFERLSESDAARRQTAVPTAHDLLREALAQAKATQDRRSFSQALGQLAGLYQGERRYTEALHLTRRARGEAEAADAPDLVSRWHWQEGRLLWAQGQASAALSAYRRALALLQETRQETLARYGAAGFRQALAPVYLDFAEALLASASRLEALDRQADAARLLLEARATVEELKAAELRDYFRDECVAEIEARTADLDQVLALSAGRAAVIYPILLPDRLELLVTLPSGLVRRTVPIAGADVEKTARVFREEIMKRIGATYRASAEKLYDWLVRPYAAALDAEQIDTLVFVPDRALRTIPLAALHDGVRFLVESRAVAITPGLSLVDPEPLELEQGSLLLAGVSQGVQGMEPLPEVSEELDRIHALHGGEVLLDEDFVAARFERELASGPPSVVHVASHAAFTGDPRTSFLLAYDQKLSLERLAEVVSPAHYRDEPLELLVLSACETASGDERAALGLAGAAIRAGARSAVGSLWRIHDRAAKDLVVDFYESLGDPGVSKARALQSAQLHLRADPQFAHPFYWSPYLLISNWM